jgi:GNAT superfamily N-acetyltransferase
MSAPITYEQGYSSDNYDVFLLFEETLADFIQRLGYSGSTNWDDAQKLKSLWQLRQPLYDHIAQTSEHFWLARQDGNIVGFARSVLRDGARELTEFFVKPGVQSGGVGRNLIERAFPTNGAEPRFIIASADFRAQALYLKSGVFPRFPIYYFGREPEQVPFESDLQFVPLASSPETLSALAAIDKEIIGFQRNVDQQWFIANRRGFLYVRDGRPVGYGYVGHNSGPFALLDAADFPTVLAHAESTAQAEGQERFGMEVPMVNETAVSYLLSHNYKIDVFIAMFMSDRPFGSFDRYIITSPPFFV